MKLSLRRRGVLALVAVGAYIVVGGAALESERQYLRSLSLELELLHEKEAALGRILRALHGSLVRANELGHAGGLSGSGANDVALALELVHSGLLEVARYSPLIAEEVPLVERLVGQLRRNPTPALLDAVNQVNGDLDRKITVVQQDLHRARAGTWARFHRAYDRMTLVGVMVNLIGVIVLGTLVTLFFSRLALDLGKLKARATGIVTGYRGPPLTVTRSDEVGELMAAVNHMQTELREREKNLEIAREQHYHREKMAAMGSLVSAVAHEINNPIAAIVGVAQAMSTAHRTGRGADARVVVDGPEMILEQTQRIATISRQIAEFARPPTETPGMIDVNAVLRSTCRFVRYDRRLRNVAIDIDLDRELPAVIAIGDHVTQVLMNLLINAADALAGLADRKPAIRVATHRGNGEVVMTVSDNGKGMDAETLARAFEEGFTTKPAGTGRGLGLFLCRSLLERSGGRIDLKSTVGGGTKATVRFPLRPAMIPASA